MATAQTAYWITADDSLRNRQNTWIEFRKDFMLKKTLRKVEARIAADSKYWLWVNGTLAVFEGGLKRGPNRTDTYYDVVDLAPFLRKGQNDVRLLLSYFGKEGFSHVSSGQAGVIVDAPTIGLVTDASWQSQRLQAYQTCGAPYTNFRLAESNIRFDARMKGQNNLKPSLEIGVWGEGTWGKLVERPIPQWRDYSVKNTSNYETTEDEQGNRVISVRLPYNMQMTPWIDVTDEAEGTCIRLETDHAWGGSAECVRAEYVTRRGRQQYESLGWINGDVLRIIYPKTARLTIHAIGYRETGYDCDFEGSFTCNDTTINRFWQKAMRTLYVNMRDNYFDCPDRERAQWWGDATILMGQSFYQLSPRANLLVRKAIRELVDWQKEDDFYQKDINGDYLLDAKGDRMIVALPEGKEVNEGTGIWYGDYIYEDRNDDGVIDEQDRTFLGNPEPKFTFGINNDFHWKGFDVNLFITGSVGNKVFNYLAQQQSNPTNRWVTLKSVCDYAKYDLIDAAGERTLDNMQMTNPGASTYRIDQATANENSRMSSVFIENGSYLRIKNLAIGYTLPKKWLQKVKIENLRVYFNVQNLYTFTKYKGYDPEVGAYNQGVLLRGVDYARYPSQRIYTFGLNLSL